MRAAVGRVEPFIAPVCGRRDFVFPRGQRIKIESGWERRIAYINLILFDALVALVYINDVAAVAVGALNGRKHGRRDERRTQKYHKYSIYFHL